MDINGTVEWLSVIVSAAVLLVALGIWRRAVIHATKLSLFSARADLFDAALRSSAFNDRVYIETRLAINGLLRQIHTLNGPRWLAYAVLYIFHKDEHVFENINNSIIPNDVDAANKRVVRALRRHMWLSGIGSAILMLFLFITGKIGKFIQTVLADSEKIGRDDDYAREKLSGRAWNYAQAA